jgi:hypothetical protein
MKNLSPIRRFWSTDEGLTALLVCVVVNVFVLHPLAESALMRILTHVFFSLILIFGVVTVWERRGVRLLAISCAAASLIFHWARYVVHTPTTGSLGALIALFFCGMMAALTLTNVFRKGDITVHRIMGAVTAYLLLGIAWALLYEIIELNWPGALQLPAHSTSGEGSSLRSNLLYFSFATLTTLGYGDILAVLPFARMLAVLEALTGQLFPAVLIARLVSMEIRSHG